MGLFFNKDISTLYVGSEEVRALYLGSTQIWPAGLPAGTTFDFDYTGSVQSVELPSGKYKLQCWGAQGGNVTGSYAVNGSKGGYSEGVLTLTEKTTLYVFVGGQGTSYTSSASQTSTSAVNGGWNGGGAGVRTARYNSGGEDGRSFPRGGGGATDISTVTSTMNYSNGRTTRDSASLLARCIVAGGGAGGSCRYTSVETTSSSTETVFSGSEAMYYKNYDTNYPYTSAIIKTATLEKGYTYSFNQNLSSTGGYFIAMHDASTNSWIANMDNSKTYTPTSNVSVAFLVYTKNDTTSSTVTVTVKRTVTTTSTSTSSGYSNKSQQGGGTSGKGQYPGKATSAGTGGAFGLGASQSSTNYRYCGGGGGGGWYGGGTNQSDSSTSYVSYSGGGSGFVNTSANASSRPSGYTGLQLDSGTTIDGNTSFESVSGGSETGHSGNGYARIIALDINGEYPIPEPAYSINWATQTGTWNDSSNSSSATGYSYTCESPGTNGNTRIRCTFSGVSSITFYCTTSGESCCDYLTIGNLDSSCTRSSYKSILKNSSSSYTYEISDLGEHYIEFCYSKDGSVDSGTDNATVYIQSYS